MALILSNLAGHPARTTHQEDKAEGKDCGNWPRGIALRIVEGPLADALRITEAIELQDVVRETYQ